MPFIVLQPADLRRTIPSSVVLGSEKYNSNGEYDNYTTRLTNFESVITSYKQVMQNAITSFISTRSIKVVPNSDWLIDISISFTIPQYAIP